MFTVGTVLSGVTDSAVTVVVRLYIHLHAFAVVLARYLPAHIYEK